MAGLRDVIRFINVPRFVATSNLMVDRHGRVRDTYNMCELRETTWEVIADEPVVVPVAKVAVAPVVEPVVVTEPVPPVIEPKKVVKRAKQKRRGKK